MSFDKEEEDDGDALCDNCADFEDRDDSLEDFEVDLRMDPWDFVVVEGATASDTDGVASTWLIIITGEGAS